MGLDIDEEIRGRIAEFIQEVRGSAPEVRWVEPEALHVTLKFIGEKPDVAVAEIEKAIGGVTAESFAVSFRGYGFFPTEKAARVFWVGIEADTKLAELAATVERKLARIGIPKEERGFSPHLTLARGGARIGSGSGAPGRRTGDRINQRFARLQQRLARRLPDGRLSEGELSEVLRWSLVRWRPASSFCIEVSFRRRGRGIRKLRGLG